MGAYVSLLEYGNIEGMILLSELSRRRIRSVQKLIKVGNRAGAGGQAAMWGIRHALHMQHCVRAGSRGMAR